MLIICLLLQREIYADCLQWLILKDWMFFLTSSQQYQSPEGRILKIIAIIIIININYHLHISNDTTTEKSRIKSAA